GTVNLDPCFGPLFGRQWAHKNVVNVNRRACFDENILIDTHRGWAVMPANLRIVVAGAGRGVKFVTLVKMTVFSPGVVAHTDGVVFDLDQQGIVTGTGNRGEIELEGRKET